jgi:hypothetical protein
MATAPIGQLVTRTHYSTAQVVDWVDQAIFYLHCGDRGELFRTFRSIGIRNATDLLDVAGFDFRKSIEDFNPTLEDFNTIMRALQTGTPVKARSKPDTSAQVKSQTKAKAAASASTQPEAQSAVEVANIDVEPGPTKITQEAVQLICDTLWPDQNMQYVLNYYARMKVIADTGGDGDGALTAKKDDCTPSPPKCGLVIARR